MVVVAECPRNDPLPGREHVKQRPGDDHVVVDVADAGNNDHAYPDT